MPNVSKITQQFSLSGLSLIFTYQFSVGALVGNLIAMLMGILVIAFATWGSYDHLEEGIDAETEQSIDVYITVVLMGIFVWILSLIAMMYDCCCRGPGMMGVS